ncbi:MAG TPA: tetratricopeptide repeat protein [Polyangiaceae bacterium]
MQASAHTPGEAPPAPPAPASTGRPGRVLAALDGGLRNLSAYFSGHDPTFRYAILPALLVAALLYVRSPFSNYIFDEQEALLANPYVNGKNLGFFDAFRRDFWGLPPDRTIGSYRPLPNLVWRLLWHVSTLPFLHHLVNVLVHAANAALVASLVFAVTRRRAQGWFAGGFFVCAAVLTEAVSGVVGIADVLGGLGVLLALHALRLPALERRRPLPSFLAPAAVFAGMLFGLFSKESAIVAVPLIGWAALVLAPALHPERPLRVYRTLVATAAALGALVAYTYFRRHFFPVVMPAEALAELPASEPLHRRALHAFLAWFQQPRLPEDPINNPLADADFSHRVAGALRVYARGLGQLLLPLRLSGDYSFPAEPVPARLIFPESVLGGALLALPPLAAPFVWLQSLLRERRERRKLVHAGSGVTSEAGAEPGAENVANARAPWLPSVCFGHAALVAVGLLWVPLAYFPHSNIPVVLPTVRAERFWYMPALGAAFIAGPFFVWLLRQKASSVLRGAVVAWFAFQAFSARWHALDYTDDLVFWRATMRAVPRSAKAQLNYSVMVGARDDLDERLRANRRALELAPNWAMAHVYLGDTLCRKGKPIEGWPSYVRGFELAPNDSNLIALGLQCLWDKKSIESHREELLRMVERHPGSWLAFLASDIVHNGKDHDGVQKQYRPRSYDGGPKE